MSVLASSGSNEIYMAASLTPALVLFSKFPDTSSMFCCSSLCRQKDIQHQSCLCWLLLAQMRINIITLCWRLLLLQNISPRHWRRLPSPVNHSLWNIDCLFKVGNKHNMCFCLSLWLQKRKGVAICVRLLPFSQSNIYLRVADAYSSSINHQLWDIHCLFKTLAVAPNVSLAFSLAPKSLDFRTCLCLPLPQIRQIPPTRPSLVNRHLQDINCMFKMQTWQIYVLWAFSLAPKSHLSSHMFVPSSAINEHIYLRVDDACFLLSITFNNSTLYSKGLASGLCSSVFLWLQKGN